MRSSKWIMRILTEIWIFFCKIATNMQKSHYSSVKTILSFCLVNILGMIPSCKTYHNTLQVWGDRLCHFLDHIILHNLTVTKQSDYVIFLTTLYYIILQRLNNQIMSFSWPHYITYLTVTKQSYTRKALPSWKPLGRAFSEQRAILAWALILRMPSS